MTAPARFDSIMFTVKRPPVVMVRGHGSWLEDDSGKTYLDFVQGWAVNCLGHAPEVVANVAAVQAACLVQCSPSFTRGPSWTSPRCSSTRARLNDLPSVERCIGERTVAVMIEPVQGEGG